MSAATAATANVNDNGDTVLTGWLTKRSKQATGRDSWKTRFFQLSAKHLVYFKNNKSLENPLSEFACDDLTAVSVTSNLMKDAYQFDLIGGDRTIRVYAASEVDRQHWIDAINKPKEYSGPSSTASERPARALVTARRHSHTRAKSEGARARARSVTRTFTGSPKCVVCGKTAYPKESISCDGVTYHKRCFRCQKCNVRLTVKGYSMIHGNAYCTPHFKQLFQASGGKYDRAFGSIYTNSSDPLAKVITKAATEVVPASSSSSVAKDSGPAVAEFSDEDNDSLSEGEENSRDRLAIQRKSRINDQVSITSSAQKQLEDAYANAEVAEKAVKEESQ